MVSPESTVLAPLLSFDEYQRSRDRFFPSVGSLQWYVRRHKAALIQAGALLLHRGAWHVHGGRFDGAVLALAQGASKGGA